MKRSSQNILLIAACAGIAGCGGNYSNEDVEFLSALPVRAQLESKLPAQGMTQSTLEGTRRDGLSVGDPSPLYLDTRGGSDAFNGGLFALLTLIDDIRRIAPTHRELDKRVWGPFPDKDRPGFITEVVMERTQLVAYDYRIESRRSDAPSSSPWVPLVRGNFRATGGARKGTGEVHLFAQAARNAGVPIDDPNLTQLDTLDMNYVTDQSPIQVTMVFKAIPMSSFDTLEYAYAESNDGQGSIQFIWTIPLPSPLPPARVRILSRWLATGAGRADILVLDGSFQLAQAVECWDAQFRVTYSDNPWSPPPVGNLTGCAF